MKGGPELARCFRNLDISRGDRPPIDERTPQGCPPHVFDHGALTDL
jgi:hypothetical protein